MDNPKYIIPIPPKAPRDSVSAKRITLFSTRIPGIEEGKPFSISVETSVLNRKK